VLGGAQKTITTSNLDQSVGIAVDASGALYVADSDHNRILKETPTPGGYTEAVIATTSGQTDGIALDAQGNIYFGDNGAGHVLMQTPTGTQTVIPTGALESVSGLAVDAKGNVYIVDNAASRVLKETLSNGAYTERRIGSGLLNPKGIAVDASDNLYITDTGNNRVLKEAFVAGAYTQSVIVSTGLGNPWGVALDAAGDLYIADPGYSRLLKETVSGTTYMQTTVPTSVLNNPLSLAVDGAGDVYVDQTISGDGTQSIVEVFTGAVDLGLANIGTSSTPISLVFEITAAGSIGVPRVVTQGITHLDFRDAGTGTCTTNGTAYVYYYGSTCTVDAVFSPKVAGIRYGAVELTNSSGTMIATGYVEGTGFGPQLQFPPGVKARLPLPGVTNTYALAVDAAGNVFISQTIVGFDPSNGVVKETWNGNSYTQSTVASGFSYPTGLAIDGAGNVYVADQDGLTVYKETPAANGTYTQSVVDGTLGTVAGVAVDGAGNVYIGRGGIGVEKETLSAGGYVRSEIFYTFYASSIGVDASGDLFIATDDGILKETPSGGGYVQTTINDNNESRWVAVDGLGNVYATIGFSGGTIWKETPSSGSYVASELATSAADVAGMAVDAFGNVYFSSDAATSEVWKLDYADPPVLHFDATAVGSTSADSPHAVTLANTGNATMNLPIPTAGTNPGLPSGFTLDDNVTSACPLVDAGAAVPGSLVVGASCVFSVSFSPQSSSDTSGWLGLTYDAPDEESVSYLPANIPLVAGGAKLTPTLTWDTPAPVIYGTALSAAQLNATASVHGTFAYSPAVGKVLKAGTQTLTVTFTPTDATDYTPVTATVTLTVTPATPVITWFASAAIGYGTPLSATQLDAKANVAGTFVYTPAAGTVLRAGMQALNVTFTPTDTSDYTGAESNVTLDVTTATPLIAWRAPAPIIYGTPLSATQLDATSKAAGTFMYTPAAATVLYAGSQTLLAVFTPTDTTDYVQAEATATLTVTQATPVITWPAPAPITYGTLVSSAEEDATANVPGIFSYSQPVGWKPKAGTHSIAVTFTPGDSNDYKTVSATGTLTVDQATPSITWASPSPIIYGTALSAAQLDATVSAAATCTYTPAVGTILAFGNHTLSVSCVPADTVDYTAANASVKLTVNKATPLVTWPAPAPITFGTAVSATQENATANVPGTFAYSQPVGWKPVAGMHSLAAYFTPNDATDYVKVTTTVTLTVNQATPTVTWAKPAAITYGAALSATQLDAQSNVPGTFSFTPGIETVLSAGTQSLSATFTPTDAADYTTATITTTLTVNKATPVITWPTPAPITYGTTVSAVQEDATANIAGTFTYSQPIGWRPIVGTHTLAVTLTPTDATDYKTTNASITLTVDPAP
jgi:sugar lactone lactonase YvrE